MTEQIFDWNWFFAAFAQSGAALIGIIAAFIISKIIGEIEKEENFSNELKKLLIDHNDLLKKIDYRGFHWHDRLTVKYSSKIDDAIKELHHLELITDEQKMEFLLEIQPNLYGTEDCLTAFNKKIEKVESEYGIQFTIPSLPPPGLWDDINDEREIIHDLKIQSESMIEKFKYLKGLKKTSISKLKPIQNVIWVLIFGFIIAVAYPLHFMPLKINEYPSISFEFSNIISNIISIRGILILLLVLVIEGILVYFLILIREININYSSIQEAIKSDHLELKKYSKYFR